MRVVIIVQARMLSTRLPGKVLKPVLGKPLLAFLIERLRKVQRAHEIVVATTTNEVDRAIAGYCHQAKVPVYLGSEENVLSRYYEAAQIFGADVVVRITADCPLIDPVIVDQVISFYLENQSVYDYVSNTQERSFPRGMDVEVFSFTSLQKAHEEATQAEEREHVTPYFYKNPQKFRIGSFLYRLTVDTEEDFQLISHVLESLHETQPNFQFHDVVALLERHPEWAKANMNVKQKQLDDKK